MAKKKSLFDSSKNIKRREFIKIAAAAAAAVAVPVLAQVETDVGTLDKAAAARESFQQAAVFALRRTDFPTRPFFGDTHLHTQFLDGCRSVRHPLSPARCVSFRAAASRSWRPAGSP